LLLRAENWRMPYGKLTERQAWGTAVRIASVIHALAAVINAVTA
jgi:hypothetical protein